MSRQDVRPEGTGEARLAPIRTSRTMPVQKEPRSLLAWVTEQSQGLWRALTVDEISAAFGGLSTFLPLVLGLAKCLGLDLGTTLIATGLYNMACGAWFGIPMPVLPMKAVAAIALAEPNLGVAEVVAAGAFVGASLLVLGITGFAPFLHRFVPGAAVRGVQLALGLELSIAGVRMVCLKDSREELDLATAQHAVEAGTTNPMHFYLGLTAAAFILLAMYPRNAPPGRAQPAPSPPSSHGSGSPRAVYAVLGASLAEQGPRHLVADDQAIAGLAALAQGGGATHAHGPPGAGQLTAGQAGSMSRGFDSSASLSQWLRTGALATSESGLPVKGPGQRWRIPAALLVVLAGVAVTLTQRPGALRGLRLGPARTALVLPTRQQWQAGVREMGVAQLAVSLLSSLGTARLAAELFPGAPAAPRAVCLSQGFMNLLGACLGVVPCCHGADSLAIQARFGARTGAAPIFLGCLHVALGLLFGHAMGPLLRDFPRPLLGSLLIFAGVELASKCRGAHSERDAAVMLIAAATGMALRRAIAGFLAGAACAGLLWLWDAVPLPGGWAIASKGLLRSCSGQAGDVIPHDYERLPCYSGRIASASAGMV